MSCVLRRRMALGVCLMGCCMLLFAGLESGQAARSRRSSKPKAKPAPVEVTVKGKVATFEKSIVLLTTGKKFKLDPIKTAVLTRRGKTPPEAWKKAIAPGDDVVVVYDSKAQITRSVKVAPPFQIPNGEYEVLGQTTYVYSDPKSPDAEGKEVPLLWVKSTDPSKKFRYVVELTDATALVGEGIDEGTAGGPAIKKALQPKSIVEIMMFTTTLPTVDKYGDAEAPTPLNGVVKLIKVTQAPAAPVAD